MKAHLQSWIETLGDQFWLRPGLIVLGCIVLAQAAVLTEGLSFPNINLPLDLGLYSGGAEGARGLLSTIASSSIGVAGTVFSITIAALTLASGQMGPRLLRNFVRDGRNQSALGIFLGTFAYALTVLRTIRTVQETAFVPHLAITGAMVLALMSIATLVWFVHHIATGINVETVIGSVHGDLCNAIRHRMLKDADVPFPHHIAAGSLVSIKGSGYLQAVDRDALADWAAKRNAIVRLRVRAGDFVPVSYPVAEIIGDAGQAKDAAAIIDHALAFGHRQSASQDFEYSVRQLTEIAVRALSPGINDPMTAVSVLDRFGDALCRMAPLYLRSGVALRQGRIALLQPVTDYDGLCDAMFHLIRQNAAASTFVLTRLIEVLIHVATVETDPDRRATLTRHAGLAIEAARLKIDNPSDREDVERRFKAFVRATRTG